MEIKEELRSYISQSTFVEIEKIKDETLLFEEGIFDSMGLLNLISFIEVEYGVVAQDVDLKEENFGSLVAIENYVQQKRS